MLATPAPSRWRTPLSDEATLLRPALVPAC